MWYDRKFGYGPTMPSVYDRFNLVSEFALRGDQVHAVPELVEGLVRPALETWLNNNPSIADAIVGRIVLAARARLASRVRAVFRSACLMAGSAMLIAAILCTLAPAALVGVFSSDPQVIAVGEEYLRSTSWNFVASGLIFVASSMFQALGNTLPALLASFSRLALVAVPTLLLARLPNFELRWIWYLSAGTIVFQVIAVLLLLQREFRKRFSVAVAES